MRAEAFTWCRVGVLKFQHLDDLFHIQAVCFLRYEAPVERGNLFAFKNRKQHVRTDVVELPGIGSFLCVIAQLGQAA